MTNTQIIQKLLRGSALRVLLLVSSALTAFFMMPFLVHSLGDHAYGMWVIIGTLAGYYGFLDFGLSFAVSRFISKAIGVNDYREMNVIINTSIILFASLGVCVLLLTFISSFFVDVFVHNSNEAQLLSQVLIIIGVFLLVQFSLRSFTGVLSSKIRYDFIAIVHLIKLVLRTFLIVFVVINEYGLLTMMVIVLLTELLGDLLTCRFAMKQLPHFHFSVKAAKTSYVRQLFGYSWIALISNLGDMMRLKIIPILVSSLIGIKAVVLYAIALRLMEYFQQLIMHAVGMMMPIFSQFEGKGDMSLVRKGFEHSLVISIIISIFVGASIIIYGGDFINLWMGEQYANSYMITSVLVVPITLLLMQAPARDLFYGISKHGYYAVINIVELLLIVVLSLFFTQRFGLFGIAISVAIGITIPELIKPYLVAKLLDMSAPRLYLTFFSTAIKSIVPLIPFYYFVNIYTIDNFKTLVVFGVLQTLWYIPFVVVLLPNELRRFVFKTMKVNERFLPAALR